MKYFLVGILFLMSVSASMAQQAKPDNSNIVQFSGIIMTSDSLMGIPFVNIYIRHSRKGTVSAQDGYFSFAAEKGDPVSLSALGFKTSRYVIPEKLEGNKYSVIHLMATDALYLDTVFIYPWPDKQQFRQAFISLDLPESALDYAEQNLSQELLRQQSMAMQADGKEAQDLTLQQAGRRYYSAGQLAPQQVFNAFAWSKFITAWKRGDFRKDGEPYIPKDSRGDVYDYEDLEEEEIKY
jgi:hypothetical protein